jgi:two-component system LytT family response regulator
MLKAIAIDDEPIALDIIKNLSAKISFVEVVAFFTNAFDAITYLQQETVDLIFLDIKMPDISGIDFLKSITNPPMVIFTTAYSEHAVQSFELNAIDYLLKPFSQSRFLQACNKAYEQFELRKKSSTSASGFIFIKSGYEQVRIDTADILYAESNGNYVQFILKDSKLLSRLTMSETEGLLPAAAFVRIHRSYIAAKKYITRIDRSSVWIGKTELPIGANYADDISKITS